MKGRGVRVFASPRRRRRSVFGYQRSVLRDGAHFRRTGRFPFGGPVWRPQVTSKCGVVHGPDTIWWVPNLPKQSLHDTWRAEDGWPAALESGPVDDFDFS